MQQQPLVVVSNRLPVSLAHVNGVWEAKPSSGGLATAMEPILAKTGGQWIGWAGDDGSLDPGERNALLEKASAQFPYVAVDFPPGAGTAFYEGYPNQTVWPLFHFFPSRMNFDPDSWRAYEAGNAYFASKIAERAGETDLIWVHDYHLMLLPHLLREHNQNAKIGFFLHIPFPSSEVFNLLPRADEVVRGLLGADLIAFHTHRHLHHFRSSLLRIIGVESAMDRVEYEGRTIRLEALPIGIAPDTFTQLVDSDADTAKRIGELRSQYADKKMIVAVDRLDYSKGIPERLRTFRRLLRGATDFKEAKGNVTLVQVAVPSREGIGEYQNLSSEISELVGEINGEFGTPEWTPVVYLRHAVERSALAALYAVADVAWVSPLRDGMNLVAKEYCACKPGKDGVLVLSQFAGAAAEMGEALLVNPFDEEQVANAVARALNMSDPERATRMGRLRERVLRNDVFDWAERFLEILKSAEPAREAAPEPVNRGVMSEAFDRAAQRLLILDYDGTLVPISDDPASTAPSKELLTILSRLTSDPRNMTAVVSGRRAADLENWLGRIRNLTMGAEHGALLRLPNSEKWEPLSTSPGELGWKDRVRTVLEHFADRAPGSFVEEKDYCLVWHYRRVESEFGNWLAGELTALLDGMLADTDARPILGRKIVEVRPVWANKGAFTSKLLSANPGAGFSLAAGDDTTDEDMFEQFTSQQSGSGPLNGDVFTVHVGSRHSRARYRLPNVTAMVRLLNTLAESA